MKNKKPPAVVVPNTFVTVDSRDLTRTTGGAGTWKTWDGSNDGWKGSGFGGGGGGGGGW